MFVPFFHFVIYVAFAANHILVSTRLGMAIEFLPEIPPPLPTTIQLLTGSILMSEIPEGTFKGFCYKLLPFISFCHNVPDTEVSLRFKMCCLHAVETPSGCIFNETTRLHHQTLLPFLV
jgi:hypothetical protein